MELTKDDTKEYCSGYPECCFRNCLVKPPCIYKGKKLKKLKRGNQMSIIKTGAPVAVEVVEETDKVKEEEKEEEKEKEEKTKEE